MMLFHAHSGFRYLVLLTGVIVILYALWGVFSKRPYDKTMRVLSLSFILSVDLTALLGVSYLFVGTFYPQLGGHIVTMILAVIVAHVVSAVMKRRPVEERTYMPHVVGTAIVLGLVATGILAIGRPVL
jgi:asparagine N-glycosylation enzyme membrane subunit Stt3